jgi:hypothetical protein
VNAEELTAEECDELVRGDHANCPSACVFLRAISTIAALRTQLEQAQRQKTFPHTTPTGHTYHEPTDWKQLCEWSMNRAQGSIECWDDAELPPDETPAMFTIAWNTAVRATEALESAEKALWHHHETMGLETDRGESTCSRVDVSSEG